MKSLFSQKALCSLALFSGIFLSGTSVFAQGLFVEPLLQYESSDSEIKSSQLALISDDTSGKASGPGIGFRLGGHVAEIVFLAFDGRYTQLDFDDSFYGSAKSTGMNYGATVGAQTPLLGIRVWGTYILGGDLNPDKGSNDFDLKFQNAKGHRVGAGIHIAAIALNLEYQDLKYDKTRIESAGALAVNDDSDIDTTQQGLIFSVGFPIEL